MKQVGVGVIGSQFISRIHAESLRACPAAEIRAVASPTPGNAKAFAERLGVPHHFTTDYRHMLAMPEIDLVVVEGHGADRPVVVRGVSPGTLSP